MPSTPSIAVLVSARKNSKYLAKFLFNYFENTYDTLHTNIYVMMNSHDTWNDTLVSFFKRKLMHTDPAVHFFIENYELGRGGLHIYFNDLLKQTNADWVVYFCEDHSLILDGWDNYVRQIINGGSRAIEGEPTNKVLDPNEPYCIVPKFDNVGAMCQILSRGYINAIGDMGKHGWIDSYINDVNLEAFGVDVNNDGNLIQDRVILMDNPIAHDYTHDKPSPMEQLPSPAPKAVNLPKYGSEPVQALIKKDADKLRKAINEL